MDNKKWIEFCGDCSADRVYALEITEGTIYKIPVSKGNHYCEEVLFVRKEVNAKQL